MTQSKKVYISNCYLFVTLTLGERCCGFVFSFSFLFRILALLSLIRQPSPILSGGNSLSLSATNCRHSNGHCKHLFDNHIFTIVSKWNHPGEILAQWNVASLLKVDLQCIIQGNLTAALMKRDGTRQLDSTAFVCIRRIMKRSYEAHSPHCAERWCTFVFLSEFSAVRAQREDSSANSWQLTLWARPEAGWGWEVIHFIKKPKVTLPYKIRID